MEKKIAKSEVSGALHSGPLYLLEKLKLFLIYVYTYIAIYIHLYIYLF